MMTLKPIDLTMLILNIYNLKRKCSYKEDDEDKVGEESGHINHLK